MLENSLAKTHYIGRDGYVWWIGQIPKQKNWIANIAERHTYLMMSLKDLIIGIRFVL